MSTKVMGPCWDIELPPTQKAVLICLADNANDEWVAYPSIDGDVASRSLKRRTGYGASTIRRALDALEQQEYITREYRPGTTTKYHINREKILQVHFAFEEQLAAERRQRPLPQRKGCQSDSPSGASNTPSGASNTPSAPEAEPSLTVNTRQGERAHAREVSKDWKPISETVKQAREENLPHSPKAVSKFISLARSKGYRFADIDAGYLLFLQREVEFNRRGGGSSAATPSALRDKTNRQLVEMSQARELPTHGKSRDELITAITRHDVAAAR